MSYGVRLTDKIKHGRTIGRFRRFFDGNHPVSFKKIAFVIFCLGEGLAPGRFKGVFLLDFLKFIQ